MTIEQDAERVRAVTEQLAGPQQVFVVHVHSIDGDTLMAFADIGNARGWLRAQVFEAIEFEFRHDTDEYARERSDANARLCADPNTFALGDLGGANSGVWIIHPLSVLK